MKAKCNGRAAVVRWRMNSKFATGAIGRYPGLIARWDIDASPAGHKADPVGSDRSAEDQRKWQGLKVHALGKDVRKATTATHPPCFGIECR
jgi:hypothetical protein